MEDYRFVSEGANTDLGYAYFREVESYSSRVRQTQAAVDAANRTARRCTRGEYDGINDQAGYKRWSLGKWTWTRASIRGINRDLFMISNIYLYIYTKNLCIFTYRTGSGKFEYLENGSRDFRVTV